MKHQVPVSFRVENPLKARRWLVEQSDENLEGSLTKMSPWTAITDKAYLSFLNLAQKYLNERPGYKVRFVMKELLENLDLMTKKFWARCSR